MNEEKYEEKDGDEEGEGRIKIWKKQRERNGAQQGRKGGISRKEMGTEMGGF